MSRLPPIPHPLDCVLFDAGDTLLAPAPSFQGRFVAVALGHEGHGMELAGRGLKLGLVSNFEPWLEDVLALQGIADRFAAVAIPGRLGVAKPDPAIFRHPDADGTHRVKVLAGLVALIQGQGSG